MHQEGGEVLGVDDLALARQLLHRVGERRTEDEEAVALVGDEEEALVPPDDVVVGDVAEVGLDERAGSELDAVAALALVVDHGNVAFGERAALEVCFAVGCHRVFVRNKKGLRRRSPFRTARCCRAYPWSLLSSSRMTLGSGRTPWYVWW